jgi:hypothetical protein
VPGPRKGLEPARRLRRRRRRALGAVGGLSHSLCLVLALALISISHLFFSPPPPPACPQRYRSAMLFFSSFPTSPSSLPLSQPTLTSRPILPPLPPLPPLTLLSPLPPLLPQAHLPPCISPNYISPCYKSEVEYTYRSPSSTSSNVGRTRLSIAGRSRTPPPAMELGQRQSDGRGWQVIVRRILFETMRHGGVVSPILFEK